MNEHFPNKNKYHRSSTEHSPSVRFSERELSESIANVQDKYTEIIDKRLLSAVATSLQKIRANNSKISFKEARGYALHENLDQYTDTSWGPYISALGVLLGKHVSKKQKERHVEKPPEIFSKKQIQELVEDSKKVIAERNGDPED